MATSATPSLNRLKDLFRGCMVGALLGDCLGVPFEFKNGINGPDTGELKAFFNDLMKANEKLKGGLEIKALLGNLLKPKEKCNILKYSDDTLMSRAIAQSLIENKTFIAEDLAKRFTEDHFREYRRGYGKHIANVFMKLKKSNYENVFEPARLQFDGAGSYGNGAAMRVAPVPLFTFNEDLDSTINLAKQTSVLTHAHDDGYNGAILLSLAVKEALQISNSYKKLEQEQFLNHLIGKMKEIETSTKKVYTSKLEDIQNALNNDELTALDIVTLLGNDVTAANSVPTAIYAFLRALKPIREFETDNGFVRTLFLAISFGGDTDTIACMAGGIAGAYYGIRQIPEVIYKQCEGVDYIIKEADQLTEIVENRNR